MFNPSYIGVREDILDLIPDQVKKILDVGCSNGSLGKKIKENHQGSIVWGIELDSAMAKEAESQIDRVFIGNAEQLILSNEFTEKFDCIIFADLLEHLYNPWEVLNQSKSLLEDGGVIIASLPNIKYHKTFTNLLFKGSWKYEERGIFDKTHLRFFTGKDILEMFSKAGLQVETVKRNFRVIDKKSFLNKASHMFNLPFIKDFFTFQYLVVGRKL